MQPAFLKRSPLEDFNEVDRLASLEEITEFAEISSIFRTFSNSYSLRKGSNSRVKTLDEMLSFKHTSTSKPIKKKSRKNISQFYQSSSVTPKKSQAADETSRNVPLPMQVCRRLEKRSKPDENAYADVVTRLLSETERETTLSEVVGAARDQFADVASIYVDHIPSYEDPDVLDFWLYTGEAEALEQEVDIFGPEYRIVVEREEADPLRLPFEISASCDGPRVRELPPGTVVYVDDSFRGVEPLDQEDGLDRLRSRLRGNEVELFEGVSR